MDAQDAKGNGQDVTNRSLRAVVAPAPESSAPAMVHSFGGQPSMRSSGRTRRGSLNDVKHPSAKIKGTLTPRVYPRATSLSPHYHE
ncbi:hypothetical protein NCS52_00431600 [Fusarium sp. LHS14.1]|nr:hypothetical protein NCS52_00431600 [Fusarium sp. LHS14.1]